MEIVFGVTDSSILRPLLFFLGDLFFMISNIDNASYADDNTPYIASNDIGSTAYSNDLIIKKQPWRVSFFNGNAMKI